MSTSTRSTQPRARSSLTISAASIVLPRPTSSASSTRVACAAEDRQRWLELMRHQHHASRARRGKRQRRTIGGNERATGVTPPVRADDPRLRRMAGAFEAIEWLEDAAMRARMRPRRARRGSRRGRHRAARCRQSATVRRARGRGRPPARGGSPGMSVRSRVAKSASGPGRPRAEPAAREMRAAVESATYVERTGRRTIGWQRRCHLRDLVELCEQCGKSALRRVEEPPVVLRLAWAAAPALLARQPPVWLCGGPEKAAGAGVFTVGADSAQSASMRGHCVLLPTGIGVHFSARFCARCGVERRG